MTLKWQKFKNYSLKETRTNNKKYNERLSSLYLEKEYGISNNTIR